MQFSCIYYNKTKQIISSKDDLFGARKIDTNVNTIKRGQRFVVPKDWKDSSQPLSDSDFEILCDKTNVSFKNHPLYQNIDSDNLNACRNYELRTNDDKKPILRSSIHYSRCEQLTVLERVDNIVYCVKTLEHNDWTDTYTVSYLPCLKVRILNDRKEISEKKNAKKIIKQWERNPQYSNNDKYYKYMDAKNNINHGRSCHHAFLVISKYEALRQSSSKYLIVRLFWALFKFIVNYSMLWSLISDILLIQHVYYYHETRFYILSLIFLFVPLIIVSLRIMRVFWTEYYWFKIGSDWHICDCFLLSFFMTPILNIPTFLGCLVQAFPKLEIESRIMSFLLSSMMTYPLYIINVAFLLETTDEYQNISIYNILQLLCSLLRYVLYVKFIYIFVLCKDIQVV